MNKNSEDKEKTNQEDNDSTVMVTVDHTLSGDTPHFLTLIAGKWIGKSWALEKDHILGRDKSASGIYLPEQSLSRSHIQFKIQDNSVQIKDLNSTNGSFLNNEKLDPKKIYALKNNDLLRLGTLVFKFISKGNIEAQSILFIREKIYTDPLCQIYNRRFVEEKGSELFIQCQKQNTPLTLITFDIDYFKNINDQYTHLGGDFILLSLSAQVQKWIRQEDIFCRIGGEEFIILLKSPLKEACLIAEKIRKNIEKETFKFEDHYIRVTLSAGVAEIQKEDKEWTDLYKRADQAVYTSKKTGRNKVSSS